MIIVTCEEEQHEIVVDYRKEAEEIIRKYKEVLFSFWLWSVGL